MTIGGRSVRYKAASSTINNVGLPYVFNEQVEVPGFGSTRALCAYQKGTLGPAANGQKWNFKNEVDSASLNVLLTYIYSCTYGNFTDVGNAVGLDHWTQYWSDIWFLVAQAISWYYEHGIIIDVNSNKEGFIEQAAEEFVAAMKLYHETYHPDQRGRQPHFGPVHHHGGDSAGGLCCPDRIPGGHGPAQRLRGQYFHFLQREERAWGRRRLYPQGKR